eukprot:9041996-Karenia_brevis.AAC.1
MIARVKDDALLIHANACIIAPCSHDCKHECNKRFESARTQAFSNSWSLPRGPKINLAQYMSMYRLCHSSEP